MKLLLVSLILLMIFVTANFGRTADISEFENDSAEELTRRPTKKNDDGMLKPANEALFGFIDKLINTGYLSSKAALNRVRSQTQATKKIEDQIEQLLESLPSFHVPVLDDLHSVNSDTRDEKIASE